MEQFDSSEEASSRVLEQQQRNDEQQCPSCAAELTSRRDRWSRPSPEGSTTNSKEGLRVTVAQLRRSAVSVLCIKVSGLGELFCHA